MEGYNPPPRKVTAKVNKPADSMLGSELEGSDSSDAKSC